MKRVLLPAFFLLVMGCGLHAQVVDTTVCAVIKNPKSFDGKMVRIKATAAAGFDEFILKDGDCGAQVNGIWLDYPPGTKGKAGPVALLELKPAHNFSGQYTAPARAAVTLDTDKNFKQFDSWLAQPHGEELGICLGCTRYEVTATFVGRLDGVADATLKRDASGRIVGFGGFGNMNAYPARLVLQSVSGAERKEEDYSAADAATRNDQQLPAVAGGDKHDPIAAAQKLAGAMGADPAGVAAQKDAAAYGKPGDLNGVDIGFGAANEASPADEAAGTDDSPDGTLFNCTFNMDRLRGSALPVALVHLGQHISDLRGMKADEIAPAFGLEYNAWVVTASVAVSAGERYVTLPGGTVFFAMNWPAADRESKMNDALTNFLTKESLLSK